MSKLTENFATDVNKVLEKKAAAIFDLLAADIAKRYPVAAKMMPIDVKNTIFEAIHGGVISGYKAAIYGEGLGVEVRK